MLRPGITTFIGPNGQGKTNLVEAIAYPSILGSHRVSADAPLVRAGAERAVIGVTLEKGDRSILLELEINPGRANRARINRGAATRARDILGQLTTVVFAPEDLALVKGEPTDRRRFIDDLMIQLSPRMQAVKTDYERALKQRNALLKSAYGARRTSGEEVMRTIEVWDQRLAHEGAQILAARTLILTQLSQPLMQAYALIAGGVDAVSSTDVSLGYQTSITDHVEEMTDAAAWRDAMLEAMSRRRTEELDRGLTLVGPHRDDLSISLGGLPAKGYASHGESWSIALAMRLAAFETLAAQGDEPLLILDDVFAELDVTRRQRLAERVRTCMQVLITAAVPADIPDELAGDIVRVTKGAVEQEVSPGER